MGIHKIVYSSDKPSSKIMIAVPSTGIVRFEWALAYKSLVVPVNWGASDFFISPIGFNVDDARNQCVEAALRGGYDWLCFIDHDVLVPPDYLIKCRDFMLRNQYPVLSGLYYTKCSDPEPLLFRGITNGPYYDWKLGDKVWVDGIPMGMALINTNLFRAMSPPWFVTHRNAERTEYGLKSTGGTEDIYWCLRVINEGIIKKTKWKVPDPKFPFLVDTNIFGQHIDLTSGKQYPSIVGDSWKERHESYRRAIRKKVK